MIKYNVGAMNSLNKPLLIALSTSNSDFYYGRLCDTFRMTHSIASTGGDDHQVPAPHTMSLCYIVTAPHTMSLRYIVTCAHMQCCIVTAPQSLLHCHFAIVTHRNKHDWSKLSLNEAGLLFLQESISLQESASPTKAASEVTRLPSFSSVYSVLLWCFSCISKTVVMPGP